MKKTKKKKPISAEAIARMADQGKDISRFFTGHMIMVPVHLVNVDFTAETVARLDHEASMLNITREAVIKTLVREGLDRRHLQRARGATPSQKSQGQR